MAQAQSDKIEFMRDLATYESNFIEETNLRSYLLKMHKFANDCKEKVFGLKSHEHETWTDQKLVQRVIESLSTIKLVQKTKIPSNSLQKEVTMRIRKPANQYANNRRNTLAPFSAELKKMKTMSLNFIEGENVCAGENISGIYCFISATYENGYVNINLNSSTSNEKYEL